MNIKKATKAQLIEAYVALEMENVKLTNELSGADYKLSLIEDAIPENRGFLFWITQVGKVIQLILTILKYSNGSVLGQYKRS